VDTGTSTVRNEAGLLKDTHITISAQSGRIEDSDTSLLIQLDRRYLEF